MTKLKYVGLKVNQNKGTIKTQVQSKVKYSVIVLGQTVMLASVELTECPCM